ncbi:MAG: hypothetical protein HC875_27360 [Anaerolineales bacterium]|nr:hypothetical protein [Anaerolineales bacterium]
MAWLLKLILIWLSFDVVVMATGWYLATTIRPYFPNWWRRVIADDCPGQRELPLEPAETPLTLVET